jgi:capsular polysaccharide biosynthesis protein
MQKTKNMHEYQEEWWRQQQEEDAQRRLDGASMLHEDSVYCLYCEEHARLWNMNKLNACRKKMIGIEDMTQIFCYI